MAVSLLLASQLVVSLIADCRPTAPVALTEMNEIYHIERLRISPFAARWNKPEDTVLAMHLRGGRRMRDGAGATIRHMKKRKEVVCPITCSSCPA